MTDAILHYYYDPLCGWCYAAAPLVAAAAEVGIDIALHGGGLWDKPQPYPQGMVSRIREMETRIAYQTGQPYGEAYTNGLLVDPATILHSRPPTSAILAAGAIDKDRSLPMLRALQMAHFVEGRRIVEPQVLTAVARGIGLDELAFDRAVEHVPADDHIAETRQRMQLGRASGFPTFVLERDGRTITIDHSRYYGRPDAFARAVDEASSAKSSFHTTEQ